MPFNVFTNGDVFTAAHVNDYLMEQANISCTSGTRPGSPNDGMLIFETDTDLVRRWNGTSWIVMGSHTVFSFTPTLTATTTNPTIGTTGSARLGYYTRGPNSVVTYTFNIEFGTGMTPGSGQYLISLPITAASQMGGGRPEYWGTGRVQDNGTAYYQAAYYIPNSNRDVLAIMANQVVMNHNTPIAVPAVGDNFSGTITYVATAGT